MKLSKIRPPTASGGISRERFKLGPRNFTSCLKFDNCQLEAVCDVMSSEVVDPTGVDVRAQDGDSRSNRSRDIRLPHFVTSGDDDVEGQTPANAGHRLRFCLKIVRDRPYVSTGS